MVISFDLGGNISSNIPAIAGGVGVAGALLLIIAIIVVIILVFTLSKRRAKQKGISNLKYTVNYINV